jgi:CheY-like chemotaxis protein
VPGRLLIVDDDDDVRDATRAVMERHGWDIVAVGGGADALAYLAFEVPDLVLLDLHMDDMNGWEVITMVRSDPRLANVQVIVVTGSDAAVAPPTRVLRKPFKLEALLQVLAEPSRRRSA